MTEFVAYPTVGTNAWFANLAPQVGLDMSTANLSWTMSIERDVTPAQIEAALVEVVDRHGALRTTFDLTVDPPVEKVYESGGISFEAVDARTKSDSPYKWALIASREFCSKPVSVTDLPTLRCLAIQVSDGNWLVVNSICHFFADGWSASLIESEFRQLLEQESTGTGLAVVDRTAYEDYLQRQGSIDPAAQQKARRELEEMGTMVVARGGRLLVRRKPHLAARDRLTWLIILAASSKSGSRSANAILTNPTVTRLIREVSSQAKKRKAKSATAEVTAEDIRLVTDPTDPFSHDLALGEGKSRVLRVIATTDCLHDVQTYARRIRATLSPVFAAAILSGVQSMCSTDYPTMANVLGRSSPKTFKVVGNLTNVSFLQLSDPNADFESRVRDMQRQLIRGTRVFDHLSANLAKPEDERMILREYLRRMGFYPGSFGIYYQIDAGAGVDMVQAKRVQLDLATTEQNRERPTVSITEPQAIDQGATLAQLEKLPGLHLAISMRRGEVQVLASYDEQIFDTEGVRDLLRLSLDKLLDQVTPQSDFETAG